MKVAWQKWFRREQRKAKRLLNDPVAVVRAIERADLKAKRIAGARGPLARVWDDLQTSVRLGPARLRGRGRRDHRPAGGRAAVLRKSHRRDHRRHSRAGLRRRRGRAGLGGRAGTRRAGRVPWLGANAKRGRAGIGCRVRPRCFAEELAGLSRAVVAADHYQKHFSKKRWLLLPGWQT